MITRLQEAYNVLNKELFGGKLLEPNLCLCRSSSPEIFYFREKANIEICNGFADAGPVQLLDELLHVMVHMKNHGEGVLDHTANQYHNTNFRQEALAVGLFVGKKKSRGWAHTFSDEALVCDGVCKPPEHLRSRLLEVYTMVDLTPRELSALKRGFEKLCLPRETRTYQHKYCCQCSPPHNSIRSGRKPDGPHPLNARCNICNANYVPCKSSGKSTNSS